MPLSKLYPIIIEWLADQLSRLTSCAMCDLIKDGCLYNHLK